MTAITKIQIDGARLSKALAAITRSRGMWIGGKNVDAGGDRIERRSPAHGALGWSA